MKKNLISLAAFVICAVTLSGCCCVPPPCGGGGGGGILTMVAPAHASAVLPT